MLKYEVQFNWGTVGFKELYYSGDTGLSSAEEKGTALAKQRAKLLPKDADKYIYGVRVSDLDNPASTVFIRGSFAGTYSPPVAQTPASPWDAWVFRAEADGGIKKVMEMRGIPTTLTGILGNAVIPNDPWLAALSVFRGWARGRGFGIRHSVVPAVGAQKLVLSIVPASAIPNVPNGALIVTTGAPHGIPAGQAGKVALVQCRCTPRLASSHVGIGITDTTFFLKNTDVGQIVYQGGGRMYLKTFSVVLDKDRVDLRSGRRAPGAIHGSVKGRKLHKV